jgi:hypothetical protein
MLLMGGIIELDVTKLENCGEEIPYFVLLGLYKSDVFHGVLDFGEMLFVVDS